MDYELGIEGAPDRVPGGAGILLVHPSTATTDRIDTEFLKRDTDHFLVVSTRTTAREVEQKLEYYDVDEDRAVILDTLSIERGYQRRSGDRVHYVSAPDHIDGIVEQIERFLTTHEGKRRISLDSVTELAYYAGEDEALAGVDRILDLLETHEAVGLFHLSAEVHDPETLEAYRDRFDGTITLSADDEITTEF